jgi:sulfur carrier protein ThiS
MTFPLAIAGGATIALELGQTLFVLGANGTGKSSLLQRMSAQGGGSARRISAGRQTWFQSSGIEFAPSQRQQFEQQARTWDSNHQSRWMEQNAQIRSGMTLYDLLDAENIDARGIATALRSGERDEAERLAKKSAPIAKINELLRLSNLPIDITVQSAIALWPLRTVVRPMARQNCPTANGMLCWSPLMFSPRSQVLF